jgi:hypothetical protein
MCRGFGSLVVASFRSYLKAVENHLDVAADLDRSKPYVPNLESSSQLEESSSGNEGPVPTIDATPLPVRKKGLKRARRAAVSEPKEDAENKTPTVREGKWGGGGRGGREGGRRTTHLSVYFQVTKKYALRNRLKPPLTPVNVSIVRRSLGDGRGGGATIHAFRQVSKKQPDYLQQPKCILQRDP